MFRQIIWRRFEFVWEWTTLCLFTQGRFGCFGQRFFFVELLPGMGQVIHCQVSHSHFSDPVVISYVYGSCLMSIREDLWDALVTYFHSHDRPWIVGGGL